MSDNTPAYVDLTEPEQVEALMAEDGGAAIIDFWSPTCGPCMVMAPDFEAVAAEFAEGPVQFCKVNTADAPALAGAFKIRSVPTLLFVHRGDVVDAIVGRVDRGRLRKRAQWLAKKADGKGLLARLFG